MIHRIDHIQWQLHRFNLLTIIIESFQGMNLPSHWPAEGRKKVAPSPAPMEAKTNDAPHLTVAQETFFPRILTLSALSTSSRSSLIIEEKHLQISMPTWISHVAATPRKCPAFQNGTQHNAVKAQPLNYNKWEENKYKRLHLPLKVVLLTLTK